MFIYIHYMSSTVVHVTGILTVRPWSPGGPPHLGIGLLPPSPLAVGVLAGLRKMGKTWGFHRPFSCLDLYIPLDSRHCCSFLPSFNWKTWTMTVGRRGHRSQEHKPQIWVCPLRPVIPWGHRARSIAVDPHRSARSPWSPPNRPKHRCTPASSPPRAGPAPSKNKENVGFAAKNKAKTSWKGYHLVHAVLPAPVQISLLREQCRLFLAKLGRRRKQRYSTLKRGLTCSWFGKNHPLYMCSIWKKRIQPTLL